MKFEFPGIILQDKILSMEDLNIYCDEKLNTPLSDWELKIYKFIQEFINDSDFIIQESSGTTGKSKTFKLSKRAMIESATLTSQILKLSFGQRALLCLPVDYIAGKMMIVRSFVCGLNLFWEEPTSMPALEKYGKMNFCSMVPLQVYNSFSNYEFFRNIENLIIGGSEIRREMYSMFKDVPNNIYETYGMAETCSHIALRKISGKKPDKYFKTLPGVTVEKDERNCLIIHAPYLADSVYTNDVVELIDNSHFLWKGRHDNLINSGGVKINPEELESEISSLIDYDFAVIGLPDEKLGNKLFLVIEAAEDAINKDELITTLKKNLNEYKVPRNIITINKIPRNSAFKVDRSKLLELIGSV